MTSIQPANNVQQGAAPRLDGKVAIITCASRGIGAVTARILAQHGATVVLAARDEQAMTSIVQDIVGGGGQALAVSTDVGDEAAVERLVKQTVDRYGRLDAAFNNAGSNSRMAPLADVTSEDFEMVIRTNLSGVFYAMKYEIPVMLSGGGGSIVNMTSTAGTRGVQGLSSYVAAKHGVIGLTRSAALDYAQRNIRVNAVAPGPILNDRIAALNDEAQGQISRAVPMRRIGRPEEIAAVVAWLFSDQASFITGAVIPIDGGQLSGSMRG